MDETPEEIEQYRREGEKIDLYRHRRRNRALAAIGLGALGAGIVFVVLEGFDKARNPCDRVRDHFCAGAAATSAQCKAYQELARDSVQEDSTMARQAILHQCQTRIERLKLDEGIQVR